MGATHSKEKPNYTEVHLEHLFLLMGSSLNLIASAGPGCVIGIGGLDDVLLKTGTISTSLDCPNFSSVDGISMGLLKVVIEANNIDQIEYLRSGLEMMARADPACVFYTTKGGEDILSTCGEVHLEKCLTDL
jgi:ribosome assembly protein 1